MWTNKQETMTQVFYCEFSEIFQSTYLEEHPWMAGSVLFSNTKLYRETRFYGDG